MKADKSPPGLGKIFSLVAVLTFLSKFVGLARDIVVLQSFGAGLITDAYNYAYLVTGNVLILFGGLGGPFHQSTVAILTPKKDSPQAGKLIFQIVSVTALLLAALTSVVWLIEPYAVASVAHASAASAQQIIPMIGEQLRIMLPLILIAGVIGILYGVSNVYGEYTWPSLSPAIASIAMIVAILVFRDDAGLCLAWGTMIGGVLQLLAQLPATMPHMRWQLAIKPEEGVQEYTAMLWPAAISTSIGQLTVYIDAFFAYCCDTTGAWTAITNSNRLVQLPLGVLLTAMLVPILPRFTQQVAEKRIDDLKAEYRKGLRILWFLSLPMAGLLLALPQPIIALLFQRGHFNLRDTELFTIALVWLVPSIIFYVGRDLITRMFYAHQDSKTPYKIAMVAIALKALLDWLLVVPLHRGVAGISLATTLITIFNLTLLTAMMRKKIGNLGLTQLIKPFAVMSISALVASLFAHATYSGITALLPSALHSSPIHSLPALAFAVGCACAFGFAVYLLGCLLGKLEEPHAILQRFKNKSNA